MSTSGDFWRRGTEAIAKEDWDFAIQMYSKAVRLALDNLTYRQVLRFTEYKKYGNPTTAAKLAGSQLAVLNERIKECRASKNWMGMDEACEQGLALNPWDSQIGADLGNATNELAYQQVAKFAYQEALKCDPASIPVNRSLALLLEERKEYTEAIECWKRILKVVPQNSEAQRKIGALKALDD